MVIGYKSESIKLERMLIELIEMNPIDFILKVFETKDIVFLAEDHAVKENLLFVKKLIPYLYKKGIRVLGMEFGAQEDQSRLDQLLTSQSFDRMIARDIMFNYNVFFPYKKYMDLYEAIQQFNLTLNSHEPPFMILNLSYVYDWTQYSEPYTDEKRSRVFHQGDIETFRYNIVKTRIIEKNLKILILTGTIHAITKYRFQHTPNRFFGQLVYDELPNQTYSIYLHEYFKDDNGLKNSPSEGEIEVYCLPYSEGLGMDLQTHKIGDYKVESAYKEDRSCVLMKDIFDGYIYLKPLKMRSGCTIDIDFLKNKNFNQVLSQFPDPNWHKPPKTLREYWKMVKNYVNLEKRL